MSNHGKFELDILLTNFLTILASIKKGKQRRSTETQPLTHYPVGDLCVFQGGAGGGGSIGGRPFLEAARSVHGASAGLGVGAEACWRRAGLPDVVVGNRGVLLLRCRPVQ